MGNLYSMDVVCVDVIRLNKKRVTFSNGKSTDTPALSIALDLASGKVLAWRVHIDRSTAVNDVVWNCLSQPQVPALISLAATSRKDNQIIDLDGDIGLAERLTRSVSASLKGPYSIRVLNQELASWFGAYNNENGDDGMSPHNRFEERLRNG